MLSVNVDVIVTVRVRLRVTPNWMSFQFWLKLN